MSGCRAQRASKARTVAMTMAIEIWNRMSACTVQRLLFALRGTANVSLVESAEGFNAGSGAGFRRDLISIHTRAPTVIAVRMRTTIVSIFNVPPRFCWAGLALRNECTPLAPCVGKAQPVACGDSLDKGVPAPSPWL